MPAMLLLSHFCAAAAADTSRSDEAAIRTFERRIPEIKRLLGETVAEVPVDLPTADPQPRTSETGTPQHSDPEITLPQPPLPAPLEFTPALPETADPPPTPGVDLSQRVEELHKEILRTEGRLMEMENRLSAIRGVTATSLAMWIGTVAWSIRLHRRKSRQQGLAPPLPPMRKGRPDPLQEGIACYRAGRLEKALEHFNRALAEDPSLMPARLYRGNLFFRLREFGKAHQDYQRMFELDPENRSAFLSVAELYVTAGRYTLALEVLEKGAAHRRGPESEALFAFFEFLARCLAGLDTSEPEARFQAALEENFVLTWSLREIVRWMQSAELSEGARRRITPLVQKLQARGGRLAGCEMPDSQGDPATEKTAPWANRSWEKRRFPQI